MSISPTLVDNETPIADTFWSLLREPLQIRFTAFDGSEVGPPDAPFELELRNRRGLAYLLTAPGDLGMARAYVTGDLVINGAHEGDPYPALNHIKDHLAFRSPGPAEALRILRGVGMSNLKPPPVPPQEHLPRWRRFVEGMRHSYERDAGVIGHHYDVSNAFYRHVLGPSMAYTCAVYPDDQADLEQAQFEKFDLVARKLGLRPGMRVLDVGCGWGGMVAHAAAEYGCSVIGVTLSAQQADWASEMLAARGLEGRAEVRFADYRDVEESGFDAISSIGLTEHIGVENYPSYFGSLYGKLKPGGRMLNHSITRHDNVPRKTGPFIDRYVFPDGELIGSGTIITHMQNQAFEVMHSENLRLHYAKTLAAWNENLVDNWDACVGEVGIGTARVWGLYMAGSRIAFERNEIQLHQVLGVRVNDDGDHGLGLRPHW